MLTVTLEFLAYAVNAVTQQTGTADIFLAPDFLEQGVMREYPALVFHQMVEQVKFGGG